MRPVKIKEANNSMNKAPGSDLLTSHRDADGVVTFCMQLHKVEIQELLETGHLWFQISTHNEPVQPFRLSTFRPEGFEKPSYEIFEGSKVAKEIIQVVIDKIFEK